MSKPVIEVIGLSKKYRIDHYGKNRQNTVWDALSNTIKHPGSLLSGDRAEHEAFFALKDVNFNVEQGDVLGIIGRNGSGKSTLLKILSQIVPPTTGTIKMHGRVASLLEVGTGFHPELTGRENIYFNGSILGMRRQEINSKFHNIVEFSEIEKFLDTPVKFYSSGMYVKLAFAVAAHLDPDILIVDEVLAVGDASFQKKSLGKMKDVAGQGRTVLFVSHSMGTVQKICNKGILLSDGSLSYSGSINDTAKKYIESYAHIGKVTNIKNKNDVASDTPVNVVSAVIIDDKMLPNFSIGFGKNFSVETIIEVNENITDFVFAVSIKNVSDVAVRTSWSLPMKIYKGRYIVNAIFDDLILEAGLYSLGIGLSIHEKNFFYSDDEINFVIEGNSVNKRILSVQGSGIVLNPVNISLKKV